MNGESQINANGMVEIEQQRIKFSAKATKRTIEWSQSTSMSGRLEQT